MEDKLQTIPIPTTHFPKAKNSHQKVAALSPSLRRRFPEYKGGTKISFYVLKKVR